MNHPGIPRRPFREGVELSILGLGGMTLLGMTQKGVDALVAEAAASGVNYFDVAPFYGEGEAEHKLGRALVGRRDGVFLACKTLERSAAGARAELARSLRRLKTERLDLYQFHAVAGMGDVEEIFASGGAMEEFLEARRRGVIRYIGFSAHSVEAALALLDRHPFDSILFPVNYICYARGDFGPQVLEKAARQGVARLAIKAMAQGPWRASDERRYPNCWYRPIDDPAAARKALRFTLSEGVTALIPPGDERLFRLALGMAPELEPLSPAEREELLGSTRGLRPLMRSRSR
jgi:aryl-alcohol dehydrogenase-like predicted oxidoreductase